MPYIKPYIKKSDQLPLSDVCSALYPCSERAVIPCPHSFYKRFEHILDFAAAKRPHQIKALSVIKYIGGKQYNVFFRRKRQHHAAINAENHKRTARRKLIIFHAFYNVEYKTFDCSRSHFIFPFLAAKTAIMVLKRL